MKQLFLLAVAASVIPLTLFEGMIRTVDPLRKEVVENRADKDRERDMTAQGIRAPGPVPEHFDGYRILAVGDSFTYGLSLNNRNTWPKQTERELQKNFDQIEILNGGKPGLDTTGELKRFQNLHAALNPNLVVIGFLINDCTDLCSNCGPVKIKKRVDKLLTRPTGLDAYSYLFRYLHVGLMKRTLTEQTISSHLEPYEKETTAYQECTDSLREFRDLARSSGFNLAVIIYPMLFRLNDDYPFVPAHTKIIDYLQTLDIPSLDLTPAFLGRKETSLWVKPYDSHPNAEANGIAARAVAPFIEQFIPAKLRKGTVHLTE